MFVQIQPGDTGDFEPGASVIGVSGEPVLAVGDEARWFGGEGSEAGGDVGALSVRQDTSLGAIHFRIFLGRPDLDSVAQLEIAKNLALSALPRFPGVEEEQPEPILVTFEPEPVDRSEVSYDDNLLVKEEAGEWTRGEGLVATLRLFAGEIDAAQVLRHSELLDYSGTGVVQLAREYLETGSEEEARTEIARLLDLVAPSIERLKQEGAIASSEPNAAFQFVSLRPVLQPTEVQWCVQAYNIDSPCMAKEPLPSIDAMWPHRYLLWRPLSKVAGGWTLQYIDWVREAMFDSAKVLEPLGEMPLVVVILSPLATAVFEEFDNCVIHLGPNLQTDEFEFKQVVAATLADCLIRGTFAENHWWDKGLTLHLSGVVYPEFNVEHKHHPKLLADEELSTTLMDRGLTNWALFEYMHPFCDEKCIFGQVEGLPSSAKPFFHGFEQELTDATLQDIGPGLVPYEPMAWRLQISGPTELSLVPPPFGVRRLHAVVDPGEYACFETFTSGEFEGSWREGRPGEPGFWEGLPSILTGESVFLVTTTGPGASLDIVVTKVVDDPEKCEEEGEEEPPSIPTPCPLECSPSEYYYRAFGLRSP